MRARKGAGADRATEVATGISGKNSGMANLTPFKPGQSGNLGGRPQGDAKMRKLLLRTLAMSENEATEALCRRWKSTRHVQGMVELLAKLEAELTKDGQAKGAVQVIILNNTGTRELSPEIFREAARRRALEQRDELVDEDD